MYQYEEKRKRDGKSMRIPADVGHRQDSVIQRHKFDGIYRLIFGNEGRSMEIPRIIHRFWSGGAMSQQTFTNIMGMQERINEQKQKDRWKLWKTDWRQILWTVPEINKERHNGLNAQLKQLQDFGVEIRNAGDLLPDIEKRFPSVKGGYGERIMLSIDNLKEEHPDYIPLKFLSDTVRLMAVGLMGGVYMDTDIGPGSVDLSEALYHRDEAAEVPLAGVQVQNSQAYERQRRDNRFGTIPQQLAGTGIAPEDWNLFNSTYAFFQKPVFNYFFASRPDNPRILGAMVKMLNNPSESGMNVMDVLFSDYDRQSDWMVPWLLDLEWATSASDAQEGS